MGYIGKISAGGSTYPVASTLFGTCDTAADTVAKVVTCPDFDTLVEGVVITIKFTYGNTAAHPTLNVNSTGAVNVINSWLTNIGHTYSFVYDGTYWCRIGNNELNEWDTSSMTSTSNLYPTLSSSRTANYGVTGQYKLSGVYVIPGVDSSDRPDGTGDLRATKFNGYTLAAASAKGVDTSISSGSSSANLPTTAAVASYVASQMSDVAGALVYKGTVSAMSALLNTALNKGWYYIVDTAGTYGTSVCEPGDMIIVHTAGTYTTASALAAAVDVIQTNIDTISNSEIDTIVAS